jgi:cytochrome c-type biogenesis protein
VIGALTLPGSFIPALLVAFVAGMISFLSPCVLPLVPGYVAMVSGVNVAELAEGHAADTAKVVRSTLLFVAGFTVVFVGLGATASQLGQVLQEHQRAFDEISGVIIIVMGLFLAGAISPRLLMAERRFHVTPGRLGPWFTPILGMAFAFGWTPCIGPVLGTVLTQAERADQLNRAVALLFSYSLGLGVPFVLTGVAFGRMAVVFSWVKRHYRPINLISGLALAGFGVLLLTHRVSWVSTRILDAMDALHLTWLARS